MKERVEIVLADQLRQLVVGAEVGRGERGERRRIELRLFSDRGDELARPIDEQRASRVAVEQKALE